MKFTVTVSGYLGLVSGACLADLSYAENSKDALQAANALAIVTE